MCEKKILSIIVPVYNVKREYLEKCFDSLYIQKNESVEYIIIDDGSEVETARDCDEFAKKETRAIVIHQKNMGLAGARNTGIENSNGEFLLFLDSDDWLLEENTVDKIIDIIKSNSIDVYFFRYVQNQITKNKKYVGSFKNEYSIEDIQRVIIRKETIGADVQVASAWAKVFRKDFLVRNGLLYDVELRRTQDRFFMFKLMDYNPEYDLYDLNVMCFNTLNENSLSRKYDENNIKFLLLYYHKLKKYVEETKHKNHNKDLEFLLKELFFEVCLHSVFHKDNKNAISLKYSQFLKCNELFKSEGIIYERDDEMSSLDGKILNACGTSRLWLGFILFRVKQFEESSKNIVKKMTRRIASA